MSDRVTVNVSHRLGKAEAARRLREGLARAHGQFGPAIVIEHETWDGDRLQFRMRAFGQAAAGSIEVLEESLLIEVSLPWLLAKVANRLLPALRKGAVLLLERK